MIKLLLKTVSMSSSGASPSVDTALEGGGLLTAVMPGWVGLFLGIVIPRGPTDHVARKSVDSTNVCLLRQGPYAVQSINWDSSAALGPNGGEVQPWHI